MFNDLLADLFKDEDSSPAAVLALSVGAVALYDEALQVLDDVPDDVGEVLDACRALVSLLDSSSLKVDTQVKKLADSATSTSKSYTTSLGLMLDKSPRFKVWLLHPIDPSQTCLHPHLANVVCIKDIMCNTMSSAWGGAVLGKFER